MNNLKNRVQLIGNLGKNPEVVVLTSGKRLARFSLATSDSYKNQAGEKITETQWHSIVAWEKIAIFAEKYLKKGNQIAVEGKLIHRNYEDAKGEKHYVTEVVANEVLLLKSANALQ